MIHWQLSTPMSHLIYFNIASWDCSNTKQGYRVQTMIKLKWSFLIGFNTSYLWISLQKYQRCWDEWMSRGVSKIFLRGAQNPIFPFFTFFPRFNLEKFLGGGWSSPLSSPLDTPLQTAETGKVSFSKVFVKKAVPKIMVLDTRTRFLILVVVSVISI